MTRRLALPTAMTALAALPAMASAFGEPPLPATEISRVVTLPQAAANRMVDITGKGGFSGDQAKVDLRWKPLPGPVRITLRIDFTGFANPAGAKAPLAVAVAKGVAQLNRFVPTGSGLPKVVFDVQYTVSGRGAAPVPGYHQVTVINDADYRSGLESAATPNAVDGVKGTWSTQDLFNARTFAHEALHLAGLPDRYDTFYREPGGRREYPAPRTLDRPADVDEWARSQVPPLRPGGAYTSRPQRGAGCDVMADQLAACARLTRRDLRNLAAQAGVRLHADAGDLLANKDATRQDFGVGAPLDLFAPRNGTASVNGLVVFCVDEDLHIPVQGGAFDVLGPAAAVGGPGYAQLQAVLTAVAALPPNPGRPDEPEGAQAAVWAVTDPSPQEVPSGPALTILQAAGVDVASRPGTPDVPNPNAAAPGTAAVTPAGTVVPEPAPTAAPAAVRARLTYAVLSRTTFRARRAVRPLLTVALEGQPASLTVRVQRLRGGAWRPIGRFPDRPVGVGEDVTLGLELGRLAAGRYRLRIVGAGVRTVAFTVR